MSIVALNNVSGMFLDFIISKSVILYYQMLCFFKFYKQQVCFQIIFPFVFQLII